MLLLIVFSLLALAAVGYGALRVPARLYFRIQSDPFSGRCMLHIHHPLYKRNYRIRFTLLSAPCLRLELLRGDGRVTRLYEPGKPRGSGGKVTRALLADIDVIEFDVKYIVGIDGAPAATAMACGLLSALTGAAFPPVFSLFARARASVQVAPLWDCDRFRVNLEGILEAPPVHIIRVILTEKKEKRHDASH